MRTSRYILIILVVFVIIILWFFMPVPPSDIKGSLYSRAYLTGMVRVPRLWGSPFPEIISSLPGKPISLPSIPFFIKPFLPPAAEIYIFGSKEGGGRAVAIDLGWRSRLFRILHGFIIGQIQYRGFGAAEGENIIRTPSGLKLLVYQDAGTLFLAEGEELIGKILKPDLDKGKGLVPGVNMEQDIAYISFSNNEMEFANVIEGLEKDIGFLLLPSAGSLKDGIIELRYAKGETLSAEISLGVRGGGNTEDIEGDIGYLIDILDRFLSTKNFKTEKTINKETGKIIVEVIIHPTGGTK